MRKRTSKSFRREQVWEIPTSNDSKLSGQVSKYEVTGAQGAILERVFEVCLIAKDESQEDGREVVITLSAEQARTLQGLLNSFAYEAKARNERHHT